MNINNDKRKYRFLENIAIADIAYEAYGKDLNEMFENSAMAIFELSANLKTVEAKKKTEFELENEKIEKSAISCGISCAIIAIVVMIPSAVLFMKLIAITAPSRKLWIASPTIFRYVNPCTSSCSCPA